MSQYKPPDISEEEGFISTVLAESLLNQEPASKTFIRSFIRQFKYGNRKLVISSSLKQSQVDGILIALQRSSFFSELCIPDADCVRLDKLPLALSKNQSLKSLSMTNLSLDKEIIEKIGDELISNPLNRLHSLEFINCKLSLASIKMLLRPFTTKAKIKSFILRNCGLRHEETRVISQVLLSSSTDSIHTLDLSCNSLQGEGSEHICLILSRCQRLRKLRISGTHCVFRNLALGLASSSITHLDLGELPSISDDLEALCQAITSTSTIASWILSDCDLSLADVSRIISSARDNPHSLSFEFDFGKNFPKRKEDRWCPTLGQSLRETTRITVLKLNDCHLGDKGVQSLCDAMVDNQSIQSLSLDCNVSELRKVEAKVACRKQTADALCRLLQQNRRLLFLSIRGGRTKLPSSSGGASVVREKAGIFNGQERTPFMRFGPPLCAIIAALAQNSTLRSLDITGNHIGEDLVAELTRCIPQNKSLVALYLNENHIPIERYRDIFETSRHHPACLSFISHPEQDFDPLTDLQHLHWTCFGLQYHQRCKAVTEVIIKAIKSRIKSAFLANDHVALSIMHLLEPLLEKLYSKSSSKRFEKNLLDVLAMMEQEGDEGERLQSFFGSDFISAIKTFARESDFVFAVLNRDFSNAVIQQSL